jgi:hypothetical protein
MTSSCRWGWPAGGGMGDLSNKGGWPRVSLVQRWWLFWCRSFLIWLEWGVPEGSDGWQCTYARSLLDKVVFGHAHPCFYSNRLVLKGAARSSILCCHLITIGPWWSQRWQISWRQDWRTSYVGLSLCTVEGLSWCSRFHNSNMNVGAAAQVKFRVSPFKVKIQGLALIGCAWQWPCWRYYFERGGGLSSRRKPKIFDRATTMLVHCSLLGGIIFEESGLQMLYWWWLFHCC